MIRWSYSCMVSPMQKSSAFFSSVSMWCAPYCVRLLNSWQYLKTEWFPCHRSRNSVSLWCIVPIDRWWPQKAMRNLPHGTWLSACSAAMYDTHKARAEPLSYWAAYRVFWYFVQWSRLNFWFGGAEPIACLMWVLHPGEEWRVSHQEVWVWGVHVRLSRVHVDSLPHDVPHFPLASTLAHSASWAATQGWPVDAVVEAVHCHMGLVHIHARQIPHGCRVRLLQQLSYALSATNSLHY
jgi:hypothetical protein